MSFKLILEELNSPRQGEEHDDENNNETHPKEMDGASRLKQHDNVHKQIGAFEKLLQHAMNRFSREKLYHMLRFASKGIPTPPKVPHTERQYEEPLVINSIETLRDIVTGVKEKKKRGIQKEEDAHFVRYFETFFEDIAYLKSLKKYFDEKIYVCLYDYFFDPSDELEACTPGFITSRNKHQSDDVLQNAMTPDIVALETDYHPNEEKPFEVLNDKERLGYAIRVMYRVNAMWDKLFTEEEIDLAWFDKDSRYELMTFSDYDDIEVILRLVPDIFLKAYTSIEMAKIWWTQANKVYPVLPGKRDATKDFQAKVGTLETKIIHIAEDIVHEEELLTMQNDDLKTLQMREERFTLLGQTCEKVEGLKNRIGERYNNLVLERTKLTEQLERETIGTSEYKDIQHTIEEIDLQVVSTQGELKVLNYHFELLQQDFKIELQIRPDIIRFSAHAQERIEMLNESLKKKALTKRETEKRIVLMKTNRERMRQIMRKHLGSAISEPDQQRRKQDEVTTEDETSFIEDAPNRQSHDDYESPDPSHDQSDQWDGEHEQTEAETPRKRKQSKNSKNSDEPFFPTEVPQEERKAIKGNNKDQPSTHPNRRRKSPTSRGLENDRKNGKKGSQPKQKEEPLFVKKTSRGPNFSKNGLRRKPKPLQSTDDLEEGDGGGDDQDYRNHSNDDSLPPSPQHTNNGDESGNEADSDTRATTPGVTKKKFSHTQSLYDSGYEMSAGGREERRASRYEAEKNDTKIPRARPAPT